MGNRLKTTAHIRTRDLATQQLRHRKRGVIVAELTVQTIQQRRLHNRSDTKATKSPKRKAALTSNSGHQPSYQGATSFTRLAPTPWRRLQHAIVAKCRRTPSASSSDFISRKNRRACCPPQGTKRTQEGKASPKHQGMKAFEPKKTINSCRCVGTSPKRRPQGGHDA
jgi:hypothetical protein